MIQAVQPLSFEVSKVATPVMQPDSVQGELVRIRASVDRMVFAIYALAALNLILLFMLISVLFR